jgi:hypothetical protein
MSSEVTDADCEELRVFLSSVEALAQARPLPRYAYLVVTPAGMRSRDELEDALSARGMPISARVSLTGWPRLSTALYVRRREPAALSRAVRFERVWSAVFPDGLAEAWRIDEQVHRSLVEHKAAVRARLPNLCIPLEGEGPNDPAWLHAFHLADLGKGPEEARRLEAAQGATSQHRGRSWRAG